MPIKPDLLPSDAWSWLTLLRIVDPMWVAIESRAGKPGRPRTRHMRGLIESDDLVQLNAHGFGIYCVPHAHGRAVKWQLPDDKPLARGQHRPSITAVDKPSPDHLHYGWARGAEFVESLHCWYADIDEGGADLFERWRTEWPAPHMIVQTSADRFQIFWRRQPTAATPAAVAEHRQVIKAIAQAMGGDPAVVDPARVLRVPGFANTKPTAGGFMVDVRVNDDLADHDYTLEDMRQAFAITEAPTVSTRPPKADAPAVPLLTADESAAGRAAFARYLAEQPPLKIGAGVSDLTVFRAALKAIDCGLMGQDAVDAIMPWASNAEVLDPSSDKLADLQGFVWSKVESATKSRQSPPGSDSSILEVAWKRINGSLPAELLNPTIPQPQPPVAAPSADPSAPAPADPIHDRSVPLPDDDVVLAQTILARMGHRAGGVLPRMIDGIPHLYDPNAGSWSPRSDEDMRLAVAHLTENQRILRLNAKGEDQAVPLRRKEHQIYALQKALPRYMPVQSTSQIKSGVAFSNGFVRFDRETKTIKIDPNSPDNLASMSFPFAYDPAAPCPRFQQYLRDVFTGAPDSAERAALLQEYIGVSMLGLMAREFKQCLVLYGAKGNNGKGTLLETLKRIMGPVVGAVAPNRWSDQHALIKLRGLRFNLVSELPQHNAISHDSFKAVIAGDELMARDLYQSGSTFSPVAGHIFSTNQLVSSQYKDDAFFRRFLFVQFDHEFRDGVDKDAHLVEKLVAEAPGIVAWAVAGAARALACGKLTNPAVSSEVKEEWKLTQDSVRMFAQSALVDSSVVERDADEGAAARETVPRELINAYKNYCEDLSVRPVPTNAMLRRLKELGIEKRHTTAGNRYRVVIKPPDQWSFDPTDMNQGHEVQTPF